ncbi:hypothetical protein OV208_05705 [Corallococcus sp. bb12-1]|uniref:hypothetical protein n=1 Tax=Corallococcus sp. bb12-1 TaxID=2996784 RepID=UPI002271F78F|nr:hypothetical protein [Corallococcus sp. bb12-1]MCY1040812.1 hypothetical protein [Corallococcus sp. bb12-1]
MGHTALNERMREDLLRTHPDEGPRLAAYGTRGLDCYLRFLDDCMRAAQDTGSVAAAA